MHHVCRTGVSGHVHALAHGGFLLDIQMLIEHFIMHYKLFCILVVGISS
jgi:hypothetical protein